MARYVDQVLGADEKILFDAKVHWGIYIWPVFWSLVSGGFLVMIPVTPLWALGCLMYQLNSDFAVTDKRLIAKFGFLNRNVIEQRLTKIDAIIVHQGLLGRMLNYGKVEVRGTGVSTTRFGPVAQPLDFKRAIEAAIDAAEDRASGRGVAERA